MIDFKEIIAKEIAKVIETDYKELIISIETPKEKAQGDYAFPCFRLAKILKKSPQMIAEDIKEKIEIDKDLIQNVEVVNGYLNFFIRKDALAKTVIDEFILKNDEFGKSDIGQGKNIIVEYSSPNIAKPFHIGHLRTTLIGNALYNTYKYLGYNTIRNKSSWRLWHTIRKND